MTKHMSIAEFRRLGYLQEVNRQFLHPLGLAIEVAIGPDGVERLNGIWDCRDDEEGIRFEGFDLTPHADLISAEWEIRSLARLHALGYIIQPAKAPAP